VIVVQRDAELRDAAVASSSAKFLPNWSPNTLKKPLDQQLGRLVVGVDRWATASTFASTHGHVRFLGPLAEHDRHHGADAAQHGRAERAAVQVMRRGDAGAGGSDGSQVHWGCLQVRESDRSIPAYRTDVYFLELNVLD
jgi:hypothetical protein